MPNGNLTFLDLAARTGSDELTGLVEEVLTNAPELRSFPIVERAGTTYKVTRRTALPPSGFRNANEGVATGKSQYVQDIKEMFFLDCQLECDEMIVKADDRKLGDVLTDEAIGGLESTMITIGSQVWYGTAANAKGFSGLASQISTDTVYAGGTSNTTSAYLLDLSRTGVRFDIGNMGRIDFGEWREQFVGSGSSRYKAWMNNLSSYIGLSVVSNQSIFRVRGIDSSNKLTDAKGAACLKNVPLARRGNLVWFMNRSAALTLQDSRSSIGQQTGDGGGSGAYSPQPTTLANIPIILTDSLLDTEVTTAS